MYRVDLVLRANVDDEALHETWYARTRTRSSRPSRRAAIAVAKIVSLPPGSTLRVPSLHSAPCSPCSPRPQIISGWRRKALYCGSPSSAKSRSLPPENPEVHHGFPAMKTAPSRSGNPRMSSKIARRPSSAITMDRSPSSSSSSKSARAARIVSADTLAPVPATAQAEKGLGVRPTLSWIEPHWVSSSSESSYEGLIAR